MKADRTFNKRIYCLFCYINVPTTHQAVHARGIQFLLKPHVL